MLDGGILAATGGDGSGPNEWGLVAAVATAIVAVAALLLREMQRRRADLDQKVSDAVSASFGRTLFELRQFEDDVKESVAVAARSATDIEQQLRDLLETSEARSERLTELLSNATDIVPRLEAAQFAVPSLLVAQAMKASTLQEGLEHLSALLRLEVASGDELEAGGNIAMQRFGANSLAIELFDRATKQNPTNGSAAASSIRLRAQAGALGPNEALSQISEVAKRLPLDRNAISEALNFFTEIDDYEGMLSFVDELLETEPENALLLRNRAIALIALGRPEEGEAAYDQSYRLARERGQENEVSNTARPYAGWLIRQGRLDDAQRILEGALGADPDSADLLRLLGDLLDMRNDPDLAAWCYETSIAASANPTDIAVTESRLRRLHAKLELRKRGFLTRDHEEPGHPDEDAPTGDG
jgi:tetratricopeptide (TPR) repeat protein